MNAPKGEWNSIALFVGKTLQKVKRAAPRRRRLCNGPHESEAVKGYFTKSDRAFI